MKELLAGRRRVGAGGGCVSTEKFSSRVVGAVGDGDNVLAALAGGHGNRRREIAVIIGGGCGDSLAVIVNGNGAPGLKAAALDGEWLPTAPVSSLNFAPAVTVKVVVRCYRPHPGL